jgi:hypothetical protein
LQRAQFGRRSEKLDPEQLALALEDIEQAVAGNEAADDKKDPAAARARGDKRRANWGALSRSDLVPWPVSEMAVARVGGRLLGQSCRDCSTGATGEPAAGGAMTPGPPEAPCSGRRAGAHREGLPEALGARISVPNPPPHHGGSLSTSRSCRGC